MSLDGPGSGCRPLIGISVPLGGGGGTHALRQDKGGRRLREMCRSAVDAWRSEWTVCRRAPDVQDSRQVPLRSLTVLDVESPDSRPCA